MAFAWHGICPFKVERAKPTDRNLGGYLLEGSLALILIHAVGPVISCPLRSVRDMFSLKADEPMGTVSMVHLPAPLVQPGRRKAVAW
jgi:hypothetical protein